YGLYPSKTVRDEQNIELAEAFSLHSKLIHVKKVPARTSISYGKTFTTNQPEWIGTIPIGYGDGWIRKLQGFKVLVNGKKKIGRASCRERVESAEGEGGVIKKRRNG